MQIHYRSTLPLEEWSLVISQHSHDSVGMMDSTAKRVFSRYEEHCGKMRSTLFENPFHPSISYTRLSVAGSQRGWSQSQPTLGKRQGTPWTGHQSQGPHVETDNNSHSHSHLQAILELQINQPCMPLDYGLAVRQQC